MAGYFDEAVGVDAGEAMISKAREIGGKTRNGGGVRFLVCEGERISGVEGMMEEGEGKVDLVGVASEIFAFVFLFGSWARGWVVEMKTCFSNSAVLILSR